MQIEEKNLKQNEFIEFYNLYIRRKSKIDLAAWIIRILPKDELKNMLTQHSMILPSCIHGYVTHCDTCDKDKF